MGVVLLARKGEERRAIKLLHASGEESRKRFEREGRLLSELDDVPGLLRGHGFLATEHGPALVLDYVDGETLAERLDREGGLPTREARHLIAGVADSVTSLHLRGIWHRDLKPSNILLPGDGDRAVLADFGVAHLDAESLTATNDAIGTLAWMAPEVFTADEEAGPPADIWALGVILHQCLTGRTPWGEAHGAELLARIAMADSAIHEGLDDELDAIIAACLNHDPDQRPKAHELAKMLRGHAKPPPRRRVRERRIRVRIAVLALATVCLVLLAVLLEIRRSKRAAAEQRKAEAAVVERLETDRDRLRSVVVGRLIDAMLGRDGTASQDNRVMELVATARRTRPDARAFLSDDSRRAAERAISEFEAVFEALEKPGPFTPDEDAPASVLALACERALATGRAAETGAEAIALRARVRRDAEPTLAALLDLLLALHPGRAEAPPDAPPSALEATVLGDQASSLDAALAAIERRGSVDLTPRQRDALLRLGRVEQVCRRLAREGLDPRLTKTLRRVRSPEAAAVWRRRLARLVGAPVGAERVGLALGLQRVVPDLVPGPAGYSDAMLRAIVARLERESALTALPWSLELERRGLETLPKLSIAALEEQLSDTVFRPGLGRLLRVERAELPTRLIELHRTLVEAGACINIDQGFIVDMLATVPGGTMGRFAETHFELILLWINEHLGVDVHWLTGSIDTELSSVDPEDRRRRLEAARVWLRRLRTLEPARPTVGAWRVEERRARAFAALPKLGEAPGDQDFAKLLAELEAVQKDKLNPRPQLDGWLMATLLLDRLDRRPEAPRELVRRDTSRAIWLLELADSQLERADDRSGDTRRVERPALQPLFYCHHADVIKQRRRVFGLLCEARLRQGLALDAEERESALSSLISAIRVEVGRCVPDLGNTLLEVSAKLLLGRMADVQVRALLALGRRDEARRSLGVLERDARRPFPQARARLAASGGR